MKSDIMMNTCGLMTTNRDLRNEEEDEHNQDADLPS
jgi:hypothetical protein